MRAASLVAHVPPILEYSSRAFSLRTDGGSFKLWHNQSWVSTGEAQRETERVRTGLEEKKYTVSKMATIFAS